MEGAKDTNQSARAKQYQRIHLRLSLLKTLLVLVLLLLLLLSGASKRIEEFFSGMTSSPWLVVGGYFLLLNVLAKLLFLPLSYYGAFTIEHRFGLSNESRKGWLLDEIKAFLVGFLLGGLLVELVYFLLRRFPGSWWLLSFALFGFVFILLARLAPVLIFPLFFRFKEIAEGVLRSNLLKLAEKAGVRVCGVYEMDLSRKTKAANGALMGLGKTRRIVLSDTMIANFSPDEIETVLAHELGHHKHRDIWAAIGVQSVASFLGLFAADRVLKTFAPAFGFPDPSAVATLPLLALTGFVLSLLLLVPTNAFSRWNEGKADDFAVRLSGNPQAFVGAMERLAALNLADKDPHPLIEFIFYSHPSIAKRIQRAEAAKTAESGKGGNPA